MPENVLRELENSVKQYPKLHLGLIVNPYAGVGGAVALKGSDDVSAVSLALKNGAQLRAHERTQLALKPLLPFTDQLRWTCYRGPMGADMIRGYGFEMDEVGEFEQALDVPLESRRLTSATDTQRAARLLQAAGVNILLFAGGDGTARDICGAIAPEQVVLGIPAGVKIQSGVFAVTPIAAAQLIINLLQGTVPVLVERAVRDLNSTLLAEGQLAPQQFGTMRVPMSGQLVQQSKGLPPAQEDQYLSDIAAYVTELLEPDRYYVIGPGTTTQAVMDALSLPNTLLGMDVIKNAQLIVSDANEAQLMALASHPLGLVITPIGGQGHVLGRGNQQLCPAFIRQLPRSFIHVIATEQKLQGLQHRPLWVDTGDPQLDKDLAGYWEVITGYDQKVLYPLGLVDQEAL